MRSIGEQLIDPLEIEAILATLHDAGVDFVVIGGVATILHGSDYSTADVDFALFRVRENCKRIAAALKPYNPVPVNWPPGVPFVWDDQTLMNSTTITLDTDIGRIDFLAEPDGASSYKLLKQNARPVTINERTIYVASIDDLIAMKRAAGRPKDLAHIAELETIKQLLKERDRED